VTKSYLIAITILLMFGTFIFPSRVLGQAHVPFGARMNGGKIYYNQERYDKAAEQFEFALADNPNSAEARIWLGMAQSHLKKYLAAAAQFDTAFRLDSIYFNKMLQKNDDFKYQASTSFFDATRENISQNDTNQLKDALRYVKQVLRIEPKNRPAQTILAQLYVQLNQLDELKQSARAMLVTDVENPLSYTMMGLYFFNQSEWDSAHYYYLEAAKRQQVIEQKSKTTLGSVLGISDTVQINQVVTRLLAAYRDRNPERLKKLIEDSLKAKQKLPIVARNVNDLYLSQGELNTSFFRAGLASLQNANMVSNFTIRVSGTSGLKFSGSYLTVTVDGGSISKSVDGFVPAEYNVSGISVSCSFQKKTEEGNLNLEIIKNGMVISQTETSSAYGIVSASTTAEPKANLNKIKEEQERYFNQAQAEFEQALQYNPLDLVAKQYLAFNFYRKGEPSSDERAMNLYAEIMKASVLQLDDPIIPAQLADSLLSLITSNVVMQKYITLPPEYEVKVENELAKTGSELIGWQWLYFPKASQAKVPAVPVDKKDVFLSTSDPQSLENLGLLYGVTQTNVATNLKQQNKIDEANKKYDEAISTFDLILALNPKNIDALTSLRVCYREKGDKQKADEILQRIDSLRKQKK
jgi:tetratricopeptide (TPR) repeat protein